MLSVHVLVGALVSVQVVSFIASLAKERATPVVMAIAALVLEGILFKVVW